MTSIYIVRHGQTFANLHGIFQGCTDHELTPEGLDGIRALTQRFMMLPIDKIYSSPLKRAYRTAKGIGGRHNLEVNIIDDLTEINGGPFENMPFSEIETTYREEFDKFVNDPAKFELEGSESMASVYNRAVSALKRIEEENRGGNIVVVTHGCAIRCILSWANGLTVEEMGDYYWSRNTGVSHLIFNSGTVRVVYDNDTSHLPH